MTVTAVEHQLAFGQAQLKASTDSTTPIVVHASTSMPNRYGFSLRPDRWRLDNYARNPVLLWMHDPSTPPLGRANVDQRADGLHARLDFDLEDEFAAAIERKIRGGFLNAVSVSWDFVLEDGSPVDSWWGLKQEQIDELFYDLCEVSVVAVPGDPRALRELSRLAEAARGHHSPVNPSNGPTIPSTDVRRFLDGLTNSAETTTGMTSAERERLLDGLAAFGGQRALAVQDQADDRVSHLVRDALVDAALAGERHRLRLEAIEQARAAEAGPWSDPAGYPPPGSRVG